MNFSLSGHCHEKNPDGSHNKEKYFEDHYESVTAVAEGRSEGGTEDPEVLTQSSAKDPSFLRLESKFNLTKSVLANESGSRSFSRAVFLPPKQLLFPLPKAKSNP